MMNTAFNIVLKDDNDETLVNSVFTNMAIAEKFFKKYFMKAWYLTEEDANEEWEALYHDGQNENGDKLYVEQCSFVNNEEDSEYLLDTLTDSSSCMY